jgi:replicative DNA helicase
MRWSEQAEQHLLGAALLDGSVWDALVHSVPTEAFFASEHRTIWSAIGRLAAASKPVDVVTVWHAIGDGKPETMVYLNGLADGVPGSRGAPRYAEIVAEHAAARRLLAALDEAGEVAREDGPTADKLAKIDGLLTALQRTGTREPRKLADLLVGRIDRAQALADGTESPGTPTKMRVLDSMLGGGLKPGAVMVLAARPSVGKSSLAQWVGLNVARQGKPVLMLSQEMPDSEVADRAISALGAVDYGGLQRGELDPEQWSRMCDGVETGRELPFYVDDQPALTLADIRAKARQVRGLTLLILDYVQLCAGDEKNANRNAEIEQISRGIKRLAKDMRITVLLLSQLNRQVETRASQEPILSDLRDSGAIEQDADVVAFLWPAKKGDENESSRLLGLKLEKNRQGRRGRLALRFIGAHQRWHESEESLTPTKGDGGSL